MKRFLIMTVIVFTLVGFTYPTSVAGHDSDYSNRCNSTGHCVANGRVYGDPNYYVPHSHIWGDIEYHTHGGKEGYDHFPTHRPPMTYSHRSGVYSNGYYGGYYNGRPSYPPYYDGYECSEQSGYNFLFIYKHRQKVKCKQKRKRQKHE